MSDLRRKDIIILAVVGIVLIASIATVLLFLLQREESNVSLRFLDLQDNSPIEGVNIEVYKDLYEEGYFTFDLGNDFTPINREFYKTYQSDHEGWLNISLPKIPSRRGGYTFKIQKEGYISRVGHTALMDLVATDWWSTEHGSDTIYFYSPANISGVVRDTGGAPVSGVTISVHYRGVEVDNFDITDNDGRYSIQDIRSGNVNLTVSGPGILTEHLETGLIKFTDNQFDIIVNRTSEPLVNVSIDPIIEQGGETVFLEDGELVLFFMKNDGVVITEYCFGASMLEDGSFSISVYPGNYYFIWFYLGSEEYNKIDIPRMNGKHLFEYHFQESDVHLEMEFNLDPLPPDDC